MSERRTYNPEESKYQHPKKVLSRLGRVIAGLGFALAAERAGVRDALDKSAPTASAEKSPAKIQVDQDDRGPLLSHSQPDLNSENTGDERERIINEEDEVEAQRLEKVARAQDMIDLLGENYGSIFTVDCDSDGVCKVSLQEGLPGATGEDLHVFDFRFDESGTCYVKEIIAGEESVTGKESGNKMIVGSVAMETGIEDGPEQNREFLSKIAGFMGDSDRLDDETQDQIFGEIEDCFSQGKTAEETIKWLIDNRNEIIKEKSSAKDLLRNLYLKYLEAKLETETEGREYLNNYYDKLEDYFNKEDNS